MHGKDIAIHESLDHLRREHRAFAQKNRHVILVYILPENHAFLQASYGTLLQHHLAPFHGETVGCILETHAVCPGASASLFLRTEKIPTNVSFDYITISLQTLPLSYDVVPCDKMTVLNA